MESTVITSLKWIPRGIPRSVPKNLSHYILDEDEVRNQIKSTSKFYENFKHDYSKEEYKKMIENDTASSEIDDFEMNDVGNEFFNVENNLEGLKSDPYLLSDVVAKDLDEEDALHIKESDSLLATINMEDDSATLQVYLYSILNGDFYVHHDVIIGGYPLSLEWFGGTNSLNSSLIYNNAACIGSYDGSIQIWDLDVVEKLEPEIILNSNSNKTAHKGSVMCLDVHPYNPYLLASGSADYTIKIWDIESNKSVNKYKGFNNKVQCVEWHPVDKSVLISSSYDSDIHIWDIRGSKNNSLRFKYDDKFGDPESIILPTSKIYGENNKILVSTENGHIVCFDIRRIADKSTSAELFNIKANTNNKPITSITTTNIPNMLVSCDITGTSKVWDLSNPSICITSKDLKGGRMFNCHSCPDELALVAFGGEDIILWNIEQDDIVVEHFGLNSIIQLKD